MNNFEGDPEEFARTFCEDMKIEEPEVGPAIAIAIREQLYEIAKQGVASVRESRTNKKGRRGMEHLSASKVGSPALDLGKLFDPDGSIQRGKSECDAFEPIVSHLSNEEVDALEAREERLPR
uniref:SNF5 n=2 Tax=Solanum tuberosum TaxID=4113 RepID=M1CNR0_SOLTU